MPVTFYNVLIRDMALLFMRSFLHISVEVRQVAQVEELFEPITLQLSGAIPTQESCLPFFWCRNAVAAQMISPQARKKTLLLHICVESLALESKHFSHMLGRGKERNMAKHHIQKHSTSTRSYRLSSNIETNKQRIGQSTTQSTAHALLLLSKICLEGDASDPPIPLSLCSHVSEPRQYLIHLYVEFEAWRI